MKHVTRTLLALAAFGLCALPVSGPARAEFPQVKINFVDTTEAPKIRVWASVARRGFRPPGDKDLVGATIFRVPEKGTPQELFAIDDGKISWPKGLSEEDIKKKEATPPEFALAADLDKGQAIVVIAPGFQDPEYRDGPLGERSRNGAGLFFKKLGKNNLMNVIWAADYVKSYVHAYGRDTSLSKLESEREQCFKWERERLKFHGMTPEELLEAEGPPPTEIRKEEAYCGLTKNYENFPKILTKTVYEGFHPNLFGLSQKLCVPPPPEHDRKTTGGPGEESEETKRLAAIDIGLEMLAKHPDPAMPKVLIVTGDGRDGYINALTDCRRKYELECQSAPEVAAIQDAKKRRAPLTACVNNKLADFIATEQRFFIERLPGWLAIAKAANIRIYAIVHPTATDHSRERLEVLAWRTGGTAHYAADINQVSEVYEKLIAELSHQMVITFVDDEAKPGTEVSYSVEARGKIGPKKSEDKALSPPFKALVPHAIEKSTVNELKDLGQKKLGKTGFMAALAGVGVLLLALLVGIGKKILGAGQAAGAKGMKSAQGAAKGGSDAAAKAKAKAIEKAKKAKEAQKKAMEKAKKG